MAFLGAISPAMRITDVAGPGAGISSISNGGDQEAIAAIVIFSYLQI